MTRLLSYILPFVIALGAWQAITATDLVDPSLLPSAVETMHALAELLGGHDIYASIAATASNCFIGLAAGFAIGVPLGAAMAISKGIDGFFGPLIKATYSLPKTSLVPLFILWFGVGSVTEVAAVILAALLPLVIYTYHGVQGVPRVLIWSASAMGTPRRAILWRILLPASQHAIMTGLRIALGFSFIIGVATEMIASNAGIGKLIYIYGENGTYDYMFASVIALVAVVYLADQALLVLTNYLLRWQEPAQRQA